MLTWFCFFPLIYFLCVYWTAPERCNKKSNAVDLCFVTSKSLFQLCSLSLSSDILELREIAAIWVLTLEILGDIKKVFNCILY